MKQNKLDKLFDSAKKKIAKNRETWRVEKYIGQQLFGMKLVDTDGHCALFQDGADPDAAELKPWGPDPTVCNFADMPALELRQALRRLNHVAAPELKAGRDHFPIIRLNGSCQISYELPELACKETLPVFEHCRNESFEEETTDFIFSADTRLMELAIPDSGKVELRYRDAESAFWLRPEGASWALLQMPCKVAA